MIFEKILVEPLSFVEIFKGAIFSSFSSHFINEYIGFWVSAIFYGFKDFRAEYSTLKIRLKYADSPINEITRDSKTVQNCPFDPWQFWFLN